MIFCKIIIQGLIYHQILILVLTFYQIITYSEKQVNEYKEMVEAISSGGKADLKDKKLIDLAKKNRSL